MLCASHTMQLKTIQKIFIKLQNWLLQIILQHTDQYSALKIIKGGYPIYLNNKIYGYVVKKKRVKLSVMLCAINKMDLSI